MLNSERKAGILAGIGEGPMLKDLSGWLGRRPGVPQSSGYQYSELHRGTPPPRLGTHVPGRIPLASLDLGPDSLRNHAWLQSGLLYAGTNRASALKIEQLNEKHSRLFFGGDVSFGLTSLSDLVEHLIPGVMRAIQASRDILEMGHDYDGEGSSSYSESTWDRATEFLKRSAFALRIHHEKEIQPPRILHGPEGGIDLHWKTNSHELLINIPADPGEPADFYGDSGPDNTIKGKLDTSAQNEWILMWLMS